jgi:hypothetical protein
LPLQRWVEEMSLYRLSLIVIVACFFSAVKVQVGWKLFRVDLRALTEIKVPVIVGEWYNSNRHETAPL